MKKTLIACSIILIAAAALSSYGFTKPSIAAQESITGDWTAKVKETTTRGTVLWLSLTSNSSDGKRNWQSSSDFPLGDFSGLNPNAGANAQFSMQREAGTVVFTGLFSNGKGVGEFRFSPNGNFISTMRGLGYEELSTDKLFTMTIHDVGTRFISELKSLGYDKVPVNKLIAMRIHGVDKEFIAKARTLGYSELTVDKLITMSIHGINEEYIKGVQALGYNNVPFDKLVAMKIHNVNGEYIKEMESFGYSQISVDKLIAMRIHNVSGQFIREMKESGFNNLSIDDLIKLRIHGVDSNYVKKMKGN